MLKKDNLPKLNRKQSEWLFYITLAIVSMLIFLFVGEPGYVIFADSKTYMNFLINMEGVMPVYPLFLLGNKLVFGKDTYLYAVVVEQAVLATVCIIIFLSVIKKRFDLKYWETCVCYLCALLPFTTDMPEAMTTHDILTEGIAYALFYLFAAILLQAVWNRSLGWFGGLCAMTLVLALVRSQLQILFGVCGVIFIYIIVLGRKTTSGGDGVKGKKSSIFLRLLCGLAGCAVIGLAGIWSVGRIGAAYQDIKTELRTKQQEAQQAEQIQQTQEQNEQQTEVQQTSGQDSFKPTISTSQYVTLIFSRGMYEADYEDYLLFEDEQVRNLYLDLYNRIDEKHYRYVYAEPGLYMWRDIVGGIGAVGSACFHPQSWYYEEHYPELVRSSNYSAVRSNNQLTIGLALLKAHFGRFLYHTIMLLPQAFICTVFFQIERIYLLCHLVTLFLYVSAIGLMIWAYKDKKVKNSYGEFMCSVLCTNLILIFVISLVFFGQQRYLVYNFGIFYISYFLLLMQLWKIYGRNLVLRLRGNLRHRSG